MYMFYHQCLTNYTRYMQVLVKSIDILNTNPGLNLANQVSWKLGVFDRKLGGGKVFHISLLF